MVPAFARGRLVESDPMLRSPPYALGTVLLAALPLTQGSTPPARPAARVDSLQDEPGARGEEPEAEVQVRAFFDTSHFVPGSWFHAVVVFEVPEGWHIYWKNSGDTGFPTQVAAKVPEGVEARPVRYPGPERILSGGGLESFGYHGTVGLFLPLRVPEGSDLEGFELHLDVSWLVCKEACFLGESSLALELGRARASAGPPGIDPKHIQSLFARLPRPASELQQLSVGFEPADERLRVRASLPGTAHLEYFPAPEMAWQLDRQHCLRDSNSSSLTIDLSPPFGVEDPEARLTGVLRIEEGDRIRFFELDHAPPEAGG